MTSMDLLQYIGAADDKYIMESRRRPKKRQPRWPMALAACAALVVICGAAALTLRPFGASGELASEPATANAEGSFSTEEPLEGAAETEAPAQDISAYDVTLLAQAVYPEAIGVDDYEARSQRWTENQVSEDTSYALNAFAYSTAAKILQGQDGSGCYSPLSLYQALSILASGAEGQTQAEILSLLGQSDTETLADQVGKLYRVNYSDNEADVLQIANSLWLDETASDGASVDYKQDWVLSVAADYYADVYQAEFSNEDTAQALGSWIAEHTGGLLNPSPETLNLSDDTVMAIVNTLWFRSHWAAEFSQEDTAPADFTTASGETVSVDFMHRTDDTGQYIKGEDYTKSYLRLSQGRMIFVLPDQGVDVDALLTEERLWEIFENGEYQSAEVRWSVPKFETDATYDLEETLQSLGITTAFAPNEADFSAISDSPLYLGRVQQGTHIAVNEEGVEAAAYTLEGMEMASEIMDPEIVEMDLNRPFIYLITANDGSPLFLGVVRNPSK